MKWLRAGAYLAAKMIARARKKSTLRRYVKELNQAAYDLSQVVVHKDSPKGIGNIPGLLSGLADYLDEIAGKRC